jgi:hypothetical protein
MVVEKENPASLKRTRGASTHVEVKVGTKKWNAQPVAQDSNYVVLYQNHVYTVEEWYTLSPHFVPAPRPIPIMEHAVPTSTTITQPDEDEPEDVMEEDEEEEHHEDVLETMCREYMYQNPDCTTLVPLYEATTHIPDSRKRIHEVLILRKGRYVLYDSHEEEEEEDPVRQYMREYFKGGKIMHLKPLTDAIRSRFTEMTKDEIVHHLHQHVFRTDDGYMMKP